MVADQRTYGLCQAVRLASKQEVAVHRRLSGDPRGNPQTEASHPERFPQDAGPVMNQSKTAQHQNRQRGECPKSPRWRVGLVCARMRNFLAGVIILAHSQTIADHGNQGQPQLFISPDVPCPGEQVPELWIGRGLPTRRSIDPMRKTLENTKIIGHCSSERFWHALALSRNGPIPGAIAMVPRATQ